MEEQNQGDEYTRSFVFETATLNILKDIANTVSTAEFEQYLSTLNIKPIILQKLHKVLTDGLYEGMKSDLTSIINDENLIAGLNELTKTIESTDSHSNSWRPPGNVQEHLRTYDIIEMQKEEKKLEETLEKLESENKLLMEKLNRRRNTVNIMDKELIQALKCSFSLFAKKEKNTDLLNNCKDLLMEDDDD